MKSERSGAAQPCATPDSEEAHSPRRRPASSDPLPGLGAFAAPGSTIGTGAPGAEVCVCRGLEVGEPVLFMCLILVLSVLDQKTAAGRNFYYYYYSHRTAFSDTLHTSHVDGR
jgi:hypothetical protein